MQPPRRDPLKPYVTDIRNELSTEQLTAIGAIALQFNTLEAHLDLLIGIGLRLSPLTNREILTRLGTIESRQDLAKILARDLAISEQTQAIIASSITAIGTLKKSRDAVVHVRLIDTSTSVGIYSGKIRDIGKIKEVILDPEKLNEVYLQMQMLDLELDAAGVIFTIHSMQRVQPPMAMEFRGEPLADWELKLTQLQNNRTARGQVVITPKTLSDV